MKTIEDSGITLGSHPANKFDVGKIAKAGCTAVIDIQDAEEHRMRGINLDQMASLFRSSGI